MTQKKEDEKVTTTTSVFILYSLQALYNWKQINTVFIFKGHFIIVNYLPLLSETSSTTKLTVKQKSLFAILYLFLFNSNQNA